MLVTAAMLATIPVAGAGAGDAERFVDLSKPGALDRLKHDNPEHDRAVRGILADVVKQPEAGVREWIRVTYRAEDVDYSTILLTSNPPRRHLRFRLDDVVYRTFVTLPHVPVVVLPAGSAAQDRPR